MDLISNSQYGTVLSIIRILVKTHQVLVEYNINYNVVNTTVGAGSSPERFEIAQLGKPALMKFIGCPWCLDRASPTISGIIEHSRSGLVSPMGVY